MLTRSILAFVLRPVVLLTGSLLFPPALHAQSYKLVGPFPPGAGGGDVRELRVDAAGTRLVYRADETTFDVVELYSVPADGSGPRVKLSAPLVENGDVAEHGFAISPDGARVVYRADQEVDGVYELYSVPIDGSASPVKLSGPLPPGGDVGFQPDSVAFAISADGTRVVYHADQASDGRFELFSAPIDGSASAIALHPSLPAFASMSSSFMLASGPARALYLADAVVDNRFELFSAPIDGSSAPIRLVELASNSIHDFAVTADGSRAAYVLHKSNPQEARLFSVPVDGSAAPLELTSAPANIIESLRITPDGSRVVYRADQAANNVYELFSVPITASAVPVRLHPPLGNGRSVLLDSYDVTADSARVLYIADQAADELFELWSAPSDGSSSPVKLNGTLVSGGGVDGVFGVSSVAASERVVYFADEDALFRGEVYSVPADGSGAVVKLNPALSPSMGLMHYVSDPLRPKLPFGSDHAKVVFGLFAGGFATLQSTPVDASSPVALSDSIPGSLASDFAGWCFAGTRVAYTSELESPGINELYSAPVDGSPGPVKLNGPMSIHPPTAGVLHAQVTSDGQHVIYEADVEVDGLFELYSVRADGSGSPVKLSPPMASDRQIRNVELSPDGTWVVFHLFSVQTQRRKSYVARADGSAAPELLLPDTFSGPFRISPDSRSLVFEDGQSRLYRAPLDGSSAPVQLISRVPSSHVREIEISPDSSTVVFTQDREASGRWELYSVPLYGRGHKLRPADGSDDLVKLNPPLVSGGDVGGQAFDNFRFRISPDGGRVVYVADQEVDERWELYSVPIAGGPSVKLNGALVAGGDVFLSLGITFAITPDGAQVLYLADQMADERFELFGVPITGGPFVRLNGTLVTGGDVIPLPFESPFLISPDGTRVAYLADQELDERVELYSVPTLGGAALKLNGELVPGGDVAISYYDGNLLDLGADGRVVFEADREVDERFELYSRPIDGSGSATKLSGPLPEGGAVGIFQVSPDGQRVVYLSDQVTDGVVELFKVPIHGGPRTRLSGPLVAGGDVYEFALSPDGLRVVYGAEQDTDGAIELYASPLPGPGPRPESAATPTRTVTKVH